MIENLPLNSEVSGSSLNPKPIWELSLEELSTFKVTEYSSFNENYWVRPHTSPGYLGRVCKFNWNIKLTNGSLLTDPINQARLIWAKKLLALLFVSPSNGYPVTTTTEGSIRVGFQNLISWMAENGYVHPNQLTPDVIEIYFHDVPRLLNDQNGDEEISVNQAANAIYILRYLWSERRKMGIWGCPTFEVNPFQMTTAAAVTKNIATTDYGWIQPLPDEVSIPLFNKAAWFIGKPAEDVIKLLEIVVDPMSNKKYKVVEIPYRGGHYKRNQIIGKRKVARLNRGRDFLNNFQFGTIDGEDFPWHESLSQFGSETDLGAASSRVRELHEAVRTACAIIIQGTSGMRVSELVSIEAGVSPKTSLPTCVRVESSISGLYDVYLINTLLTKTEKGNPRQVDWILGMSPKGSTELPLAVRALLVLNSLSEPWREASNTNRLFFNGKGGRYLSLKDTVLKPMMCSNMRDSMKRFIEKWVDLSDLPNESKHRTSENDLIAWRETKGTVISTHMLRKSWAQFVFAVNPTLKPAIQLQFHHLSIAMTDTGYIGKNPLLMQSMHQVANQQRNLLVFETIMGRTKLTGKMGEQLEAEVKELSNEVRKLSLNDAWQRTIRFCEENELKIFFSPYATCLPIKTSAMRCHNETKTPSALRFGPNSETREPSLCAGCDNFVMDYRHIPFWKERFLQNWLAYKQAESNGFSNLGQFTIIHKRALQAGKLLKNIGYNLAELESQVNLHGSSL